MAIAAPMMEIFQETKAELEAMEYFDFMGMESLNLVRKLLSDLILTTESHEKQQAKLEGLEHEMGTSREQAFALHRENARLVRENNQLHLDIIKKSEDIDERERGMKIQVKSAMDRLSEANFVSQQWKQKVAHLEKQLEQFRVSNRGNLPENVAQPDLLMSEKVEYPNPATSTSTGDVTTSPINNQANKLLEERLASLTKECKDLQAKLDLTSKQMELRDAEIHRLGKELEQRGAAVSTSVSSSEFEGKEKEIFEKAQAANAQVVSALHDQIDFLNAQLEQKAHSLEKARGDSKLLERTRLELKQKEKELRHALILHANASNESKESPTVNTESLPVSEPRFEFLERNLEQAKSGELAALLEAYSVDKKKFASTIERLERELSNHQAQVQELEHTLDTESERRGIAEGAVDSLERTNEALQRELAECQMALSTTHGERVSAEEKKFEISHQMESLDSVLQDQKADLKKVSLELARATEHEKALANQVTNLERETNELREKAVSAEDKVRQSDAACTSMRQERDALERRFDSLIKDYKSAKLELQEIRVQTDQAKAESERSQGRCRVLEEEIRNLTQQLATKSEQYHKEAGVRAELERLSDLPGTIHELEEQLTRWRERAADLDTESKRVARELENVRTENKELLSERGRMDKALIQARESREKSNAKLREKSMLLEETQVKLSTTESERDHLLQLSKESAVELSSKNAQSASQFMKVDQLKLHAQQLESQAEACRRREEILREQLEGLRENLSRVQASELSRKEQLLTVTSERDRLQDMVRSLESEISQLREEEKKLSIALKHSEHSVRNQVAQLEKETEERTKLASHLEQFKKVFSKLDETRGNLQDRVKGLHTALQAEKSNRIEVEKQYSILEESARGTAEKLSHLDRSVKELKEQRQKLHSQLENASKVNEELEKAVSKQEVSYREVEQRLGAAQRQLRTQVEALEGRDVDVSNLAEELKKTKGMCSHLEQMCRARSNELNAASQDLANMTRENQAVNASCQSIRVERDQLRAELSDANVRVSRMTGLLESSKLEKADLLSVYRRACDENSRMKRLVQELSSSRAKVVGENQAQQVDTSRLRQRLAESEDLWRRQQVDLQAYERQVSTLSRQLYNLQNRLDTNEEEKSVAEKNASTARETSQTFAQREQSLQWEIAQNQAEIQKLTSTVARLEGENEALHSKVLREARRYQDLELVVSKARRAQAEAKMAEEASRSKADALRAAMTEQEINQEMLASTTDEPSGTSVPNRSQSVSSFPSGEAVSSQQGRSSKPDNLSTTSSDIEQEIEDVIADQSAIIDRIQRDREQFRQS
eukprot:CAMPEP_0203760646 /NCGR_PEP_ID=MMETSP0098-20131031/13899_1 /ASSEMBLY_ACC=CAM_ASM_000208 /TAXON_ID=96639 /ORGANISM=" , Strain NY0313808BC1" /LENGTH=1313 /DNA_ID=CAMNT_0050654307 /DNA_START=252 /DNA_END=4189 /DNA_ORIENTATION=-